MKNNTHARLEALIRLCNLIQAETGFPVFRGRQVVGKDIPLPFMNISEAIRSGDTSSPSNRAIRNDRTDFLLSGYVKADDVENPIDTGYLVLADVEQALNKINAINPNTGKPLFSEYFHLGGAVSDFEYQAPICHNPPDNTFGEVFFYIPFSMKVAYNSENPSISIANKGCG